MAIRAALDLGSNSIKLLVLDVDEDRSYRIIHDEAVVTGLGRNLSPGTMLDEDSCELSIEVVRQFAVKARQLGAEEIIGAATAAMRRASLVWRSPAASLRWVPCACICSTASARYPHRP